MLNLSEQQAVTDVWSKIAEQAPDDHLSLLKYVMLGKAQGASELVTQAALLLMASAYLEDELPTEMLSVLNSLDLDKSWDNGRVVIDADIKALAKAGGIA